MKKLMIVTEQPVVEIKHSDPILSDIIECVGDDNCFGKISNNIKPIAFKKDYYGQNDIHSDESILPRLINTIDYLKTISNTKIETYWTHYIKCLGHIEKDNHKVDYDKCADRWIKKEMDLFQPDIILTFGARPSNYMIYGKASPLYKDIQINNFNKSKIFNNVKIFVLQHPSRQNRFANPYWNKNNLTEKLKGILDLIIKI